ncbi:lysylphosphatidylglycerol synthase domain-containing protein [Halalkalicoccus subterraneus]|uniref:lysylphosphatidylglycerol synthase domain-containing protein n=1 Tax=Halalkalicoccus subterraneus TaxID=2675002 RepID=UPI000EFCFE3A|nr:lysylphosphatidylglycerol synthase domain-containing protein [Halalkalicoccus subterraneus]
MRRSLRFLVGVAAGLAVFGGYLYTVGADTVLDRALAVAPWALALVIVLVVLEGLADGIGVWASLAPLNGGLSGARSAQFALAGDFFDILSPAGPVSSEPIMARFISVSTNTGYSEALGVRSVAKYVKSAAQLTLSGLLGLIVLFGTPDASGLLSTLGVSIAGVFVVGGVVLLSREHLSRGIVTVGAPLITRISGLYRDQPHDRAVVVAAVERYWERVVEFRGSPELLALIVLGGVIEQLLTAAALWVAIAGVGAPVAFLPILVIVPLPQIASVVPIPGSLGAYDLLLGGALVVVTGATATAATAAVLVVRTVSLPFGAIAGGICTAYLRGWRPTTD